MPSASIPTIWDLKDILCNEEKAQEYHIEYNILDIINYKAQNYRRNNLLF